MAESNTQTAAGIDITKLLNPPLHEHGAFEDIYAYQSRVCHAAAALEGIGKMMRPEINSGHQMNMACIGDAAPIFEFFGDVLREFAEEISYAGERLQKALQERGQP